MTNDQLAARSGIPLGTLSKMLAGMSDSPKLSNIVAICNALDCSVEYIVSGTPENTNNFTLSAEEICMVEAWRGLDSWGRRLVDQVIAVETERVNGSAAQPEEKHHEKGKSARVLPGISTLRRYTDREVRTEKRTIQLFEMPVSAGVGSYLEGESTTTIQIPQTEKTEEADYALRISGNSMEPKYHNGDILLVQSTDGVEVGELGIFLLDGSGYFKVYDGDRLLSLNPEYGPILLKEYENVRCRGRVVGKLRKK
jgi:phage repressor protein C with HTH and peptisase S24 domain/DNA-binding Xre family transcriptional regulator